ncbi:MAG: glycosyltransferase family 39 protein [Sorangiineae bacterium]|nr:glycosyltransferase family 39 protein [Polyangiaceae bacterium]MEB2324870.1 glycosyltransferase family 39 protein [Sorangiineae bacterium]
MKPTRWERYADPLLALALWAGYVALLLATSRHLGYARDEGFYFDAARSYEAWFRVLAENPSEALRRATIDRYWSVNHEHPALMKSLFALSHRFLYEKLHWFRAEGTSMRFAGMAVSSLALSFTYLWGRRAVGRVAGLVAALLLAFMPRTFYNAHLECFDMPVAALWLVTTYLYWRSLASGGWRWAIATGVAYGLLLDTKHNSWLLPIALVLHLVATRGRLFLRELRAGRVAVPKALVAMATIGPLVFYAGWPWIWHDTGKRLAEYVAFHLGHEYYNMEFLGRTYWKPPMPRGYAWLMTLGTVPGITLLLFAVGLVASLFHARRALRERLEPARDDAARLPTDALWLVGLLGAYAPWLSTGTPIFGGTKHWLTAYPFLCLFAARGFELARERLGELAGRRRALVTPALAASVLASPVVITLHSHPWGLSAYTPLVGGAPGAASLGLNRTFWGYTTGSLASTLNRDAPPGAVVYVHDTALQSFFVMQRDGQLRRDLRGTLDIAASDFALYHHEPHMGRVDYQIWVDYGTVRPLAVGAYDGVPVVWLYERPRPESHP